MPRPNGPQWKDAFGDEPQRAIALGIVNNSDGWLNREQTKYVMRAANIRLWPVDDSTFDNYTNSADEGYGYVEPHDVLHTNQGHLYAPAVQHYMEHNPADNRPEGEYNDDGDWDPPDTPEILSSEKGTNWIREGHHRIVASRLMQKPQAWVASGELRRYFW